MTANFQRLGPTAADDRAANGYDSAIHEMYFAHAPAATRREHRVAALVADSGQWDQRDNLLDALPLSDADKAAFPHVDPSVLAPMEQWLASPAADAVTRWKLLRRGPWVHGVNSLFEYFADLCRYEVSSVAGDIVCPPLLTQGQDDPTARGAPVLLDAIKSNRKTLIQFTDDEGAGGHCEGTARRLYHQRVFDWLDETLAGS